MRFFLTKKALVGIIGLLAALLFLMASAGCIPVTIRPEFADDGKPIAIPVTPAGSIGPEGVFTPVYPVSDQPPAPPKDWTGVLSTLLTAVLGILLGGGAAVPLISRAKTALRIACQLADANANAETDTDVERNKRIAAQQQAAAGVLKLTQAVRGKS